MNGKQRVVLVAAGCLIALMVLFPPYVVLNYKHTVIEAGYGYLFSLPPYQYVFNGEQKSIPATVNTSQLTVQIGGTLVAGILLFLACKDRRRPNEN